MNRLVAILIFALFSSGCARYSMERQLEKVMGSEVRFTDRLERISADSTEQPAGPMKPIKLLQYSNSDECLPCAIAKLGDRLRFQGLLDEDSDFELLVVHSYPAEQYAAEREKIMGIGEDWSVYFDPDYQFYDRNREILEHDYCHTLLLDRNNRVVMIGNPIASVTMWDLFKKIMENLQAHDGVYVPEK